LILEKLDIVIRADEPGIVFSTPGGSTAVCFGVVQAAAMGGEPLACVSSPRALLSERIDSYTDPLNWTEGIEGRFILAVIDTEGRLRVVADRFGKRDLFIRRLGTGVILASGMNQIPDPAADGYDQAALSHTLTYYGHRPPKQHTIYKSVRRLGVGEQVVWQGGRLSTETKPFQPVRQAPFAEREHELYSDLFLDHLAACGSNNGNVVYLSSGWDSTAILAGLVHIYGRHKVRAITGRMTYSERSGNCNRYEIEKATKVAEYFDIPLEIAEFNHGEKGDQWSEKAQPIFKDGHFFGLTGLNHMILAEKAAATSNGGEAVFAGEISDGAHNLGFSQFVTMFHPSYEFRQYADKMASYLFGPTFARQFLDGKQDQDAVYALFRGRAGQTLYDEPQGDRGARMRQLFTSFFLRNGRQPLWSLRNSALLTQTGRDGYTEEMGGTYLADTEKADPEQVYSWYMHLYNSFHWQGSTVATLQEMAQRNGMVANLPYWDGRLQQFLSAMPENWGRGLDLNPTKFPLKWMLQNRVDYPYHYQVGPHAYTYDVDPNFNHSVEIFYHSALAGRMKQILASKSYQAMLSPESFDLAYIDKLVDDYVAGEVLTGARFGDLVSVALLCQTECD
jgi:hypothetical protein